MSAVAASSLSRSGPPEDHLPDLIGDSAAFRLMRAELEQVAPTNATVLLLGETGTGKGVAAAPVHALSARRQARLVSVDCNSLPPTLIESELFGRERGAFTDAHTTQAGRFEVAHGGTLFLDEVGELPLESQAKLLRVVQSGEFERRRRRRRAGPAAEHAAEPHAQARYSPAIAGASCRLHLMTDERVD